MSRRRSYLAIALSSACYFTQPSPSVAQSCNISDEKKPRIVAILCGSNAVERDYRTSGSNCIKLATEKRFEDSAKQIAIYSACGDPTFAEKIHAATLKASKFLQLMSACSPEKIDVDILFDEALKRVSAMAVGLKCDAQMQALTRERRPYFESTIAQANDPKVMDAILESFAIRVDEGGNIVEK